MRACCSPQNSAHWPRQVPGVLVRTSKCCTRPGTMSILPASAGTQKLWITSALASARYTGRPVGMRISLAVITSAPFSPV
jgi:hypothetical protein